MADHVRDTKPQNRQAAAPSPGQATDGAAANEPLSEAITERPASRKQFDEADSGLRTVQAEGMARQSAKTATGKVDAYPGQVSLPVR